MPIDQALAQEPQPQRVSPQMRAVLAVFSYDPLLTDFIGTAVDLKNESVNWDRIFSSRLNPAQHAACLWAYGLWADCLKDQTNVFEAALSMDTNLRTAVLRALRLRWDFKK